MEGLTPEKKRTASKSAQEESEPACKRRRAAMAHTPRAAWPASVERADAAAPPVVVVASVPAAPKKGKRVKRQTIGPGAPAPTVPRTVNGTGHTGPSEFCATSI